MKPIEGIRTEGRIWSGARVVLFVPVFWCMLTGSPAWAAGLLGLVLLMGWYTSFQLHHDEVEKPWLQLWISIVDMMLVQSVLGFILVRDLTGDGPFPTMLAVGNAFLLARLVSHTLFSVGVLREGKSIRQRSFWSRAAGLSITLTTLVYVLGLEHYSQILMGASILFMMASGVAYLYWYYRDADHRRPLSVASQLTVSRIVLTPVFIWVFFYDNDLMYQNNHMVFKGLAFFMVVAFLVTDFLDGYLARRMGEVSTLGKYLDPFSDKISNMTIFLCFMASGYASIWMVALIYFRESSVETLRTLAAGQGIVMPARRSGKWKTAIQGGGILVILAGAMVPESLIPGWNEVWYYLPDSVMWIITAVTLASGVDYFYTSRNVLKKFV